MTLRHSDMKTSAEFAFVSMKKVMNSLSLIAMISIISIPIVSMVGFKMVTTLVLSAENQSKMSIKLRQ